MSIEQKDKLTTSDEIAKSNISEILE